MRLIRKMIMGLIRSAWYVLQFKYILDSLVLSLDETANEVRIWGDLEFIEKSIKTFEWYLVFCYILTWVRLAPKNTMCEYLRQEHSCEWSSICTKSYEINWKYSKHLVSSTWPLLTIKTTKNNNHKYLSKRRGETKNFSVNNFFYSGLAYSDWA